jgi:hypothetical protein
MEFIEKWALSPPGKPEMRVPHPSLVLPASAGSAWRSREPVKC